MYACTKSDGTKKGSEYPDVPIMSKPVRNRIVVIGLKLFSIYDMNNACTYSEGTNK